MWTAMIISCYSKELGISMSEAAEQLLCNNSLNYLEDYYETLHLLSNDDVVCELIDMAEIKTAK